MTISAVVLIGVLCWTLASFPLLLVLHILMPEAVLRRYWKEPHIRPFELGFFSGWLAPMRTVMLMWVIAYPCYGKRRNITEAHLLSPGWYRVAAKVFCIPAILCAPLLLLSVLGFVVDSWLSGRPDWEATAAFLIAVACFGGVALHQWHSRSRESEQGKPHRLPRRRSST